MRSREMLRSNTRVSATPRDTPTVNFQRVLEVASLGNINVATQENSVLSSRERGSRRISRIRAHLVKLK